MAVQWLSRQTGLAAPAGCSGELGGDQREIKGAGMRGFSEISVMEEDEEQKGKMNEFKRVCLYGHLTFIQM